MHLQRREDNPGEVAISLSVTPLRCMQPELVCGQLSCSALKAYSLQRSNVLLYMCRDKERSSGGGSIALCGAFALNAIQDGLLEIETRHSYPTVNGISCLVLQLDPVNVQRRWMIQERRVRLRLSLRTAQELCMSFLKHVLHIAAM